MRAGQPVKFTMAHWWLLPDPASEEVDAIAEQVHRGEYRTETAEVAPIIKHMLDERGLWFTVRNAEDETEAKMHMRKAMRKEASGGVYSYWEALPPTNTIGVYFCAVLSPDNRTVGFELGQGRMRERVLAHQRRWWFVNPIWCAQMSGKREAEKEEHKLRGIVANYLDAGKQDHGSVPFSFESSHVIDDVHDWFDILPAVAKWHNKLPEQHLLYSVLMAAESQTGFQMGLL